MHDEERQTAVKRKFGEPPDNIDIDIDIQHEQTNLAFRRA